MIDKYKCLFYLLLFERMTGHIGLPLAEITGLESISNVVMENELSVDPGKFPTGQPTLSANLVPFPQEYYYFDYQINSPGTSFPLALTVFLFMLFFVH